MQNQAAQRSIAGAQRPKASRRRSDDEDEDEDEDETACSTPEGIETKISVSRRDGSLAAFRVLNARRHRDEDQSLAPLLTGNGLGKCSTPEGIETKIRRTAVASETTKILLCSTPEGIETKISGGAEHLDPEPARVLNARRHRDEDQYEARRAGRPLPDVLNARRHRDEDQPIVGPVPGDSFRGCSTPEGIETKIRNGSLISRLRFKPCSTPEGIETKISGGGAGAGSGVGRCSTPEGIETKIS